MTVNNILAIPKPVMDLMKVHADLVSHFAWSKLRFTIDGRLLGDIAEAMVAEAFGLTLCAKRTPGVDAHAADGRSVQIKATAIGEGPAFSKGEGKANHLIFVRFDFPNRFAHIDYNGPEAPIRAQLSVPAKSIERVKPVIVAYENERVSDGARLSRIG